MQKQIIKNYLAQMDNWKIFNFATLMKKLIFEKTNFLFVLI